ncbi:MAG TPA: hypothetical protein VGI17_01470 [Solirubrobacterales bacterium]|jgi:hypothetical protein
MQYRRVPARVGGKLATIVSVIMVVFLMTAAAALGATETFSPSVTFIGDSVTAGFGYCGTENAKEVTCKPNEEFANAWTGKNSIKACAPKASPAPLVDACSNDNFNGKPWKQDPWKPGPDAPVVAYPYQLAAGQSSSNPASVSDWAVTGSTPANWDPQGGGLGKELLGSLNNQYVVMTLGANPLLSDFTDINFGVEHISGPCVSSTGYSVGIAPKWYSGPLYNPVYCLLKEWARLNQTEHLVRIYETLLGQGDRVVVLGYYRDCPWSFGNWQDIANPFEGPADGDNCKSKVRPLSPTNPQQISQWEQAVAIGNKLDKLIEAAVEQAREVARKKWPNTGRPNNIVFTRPNPVEWENHQPHSKNGSWIFLNDTWIHPSKLGHENLAKTVAEAMCTSFGHWCGNPIHW